MSAPPRIPDELIRFARQVVEKRRDLVRQLRNLPTQAQLAEQLGCTERWLVEVLHGRARRLR